MDCKGFCIVFAFKELHLFHKNNHYKSPFNAQSTIQTIFKKRTYRWAQANKFRIVWSLKSAYQWIYNKNKCEDQQRHVTFFLIFYFPITMYIKTKKEKITRLENEVVEGVQKKFLKSKAIMLRNY